MSEITLLSVLKNLKTAYRLTMYQSKKCDEFFSVLHPGDFIYPGHLKSKLCIDIKTAYLFMEDLKTEGFVKNLYEVYCMDCGRSKGIFLEALSDFDEIYDGRPNPIWYLFYKCVICKGYNFYKKCQGKILAKKVVKRGKENG